MSHSPHQPRKGGWGMNTQVEQTAAPIETNKALITLAMLRKWGACQDGKLWFSDKFPQGGQYDDVMLALYSDRRFDDANWLASTMLSTSPASDFIKAHVKSIIKLTSDAATTGNWARAATTGYEAHAATTGNWAHAATTGNRAHAATTGYEAHAATTGNWAHAATTGNRAHAATTGNWARAATTGYEAHAATTGNEAHAATTGNRAHASSDGENCIIACLGIGSHAKLGPKGVASLAWNDGKRNRITSFYEGEDGIKAGVWYKLDDSGRPVQVEAA
ncbi:hypothetical protein [Acetobacter senegalensis]|uniref:hypothetical protein n=1 Tax=Acetobacter senegalensis TaxID=446692 RepID=UPI001EE03C00|nr:hypothetical protein [Acetobacter senegalensis]MCG4273928.1 hypothetical protein [Acetobacter senegalensis]